MNEHPFARWEAWVVAAMVLLGFWFRRPESAWGVGAAILAMGAIVLAARTGFPANVAVSVLVLAASAAALHTTWQVAAIENRWEDVRESLLLRASRQLESTLSDAVVTVRALADRAAALETGSREETFRRLEGGFAARSPERGVAVFDASGEALVWAGRLRLPTEPAGSGLRARIALFYVVLEAERTKDGRTAVAQLVLAADSAVPDRDATVASRFARATGAELAFLAPGASSDRDDVFHYCEPECDPGVDEYPDTLFSVRAVPPAQGTLKLTVLERGGRRVAVATAMSLVVLFVVSGPGLRLVTLVGWAALLILTPFGSRLWLEAVFSSRTYFLSRLGPFSSSAGDLLAISGVGLALAAVAWRRRTLRWAWIPAVGLVVAAPFGLQVLAGGIAVPEAGISRGTWLSWAVMMSLVGTVTLVAAGLLLRWSGASRYRWWTTWVAGGWSFLMALLGFLIWRPGIGWPMWYSLMWVPALFSAIQPGRRARTIFSSATVAGAAGVLLIWGAVNDGLLLNAGRDVQRLADRADPVAMSALETFASDLRGNGPPVTAAGLYARWQRSTLSRDDYPATLSAWSRSGDELARLDLAALQVPRRLIMSSALTAVGRDAPIFEELTLVPGLHHLVAVPFPSGVVVTAAVGPRSRAVEPNRVARFLRGEGSIFPYDMTISDRVLSGQTVERLAWQRRGSFVVGERSLEFPEGRRNVQVELALGGTVDLMVRGMLLVLLGAFVAALFWSLGEIIQGRLNVDPLALVRFAKGVSYRARLTIGLAGFFFVPTVVFAAWSVARLTVEFRTTRDLGISQTLRDAAGAGVDLAIMGVRSGRRLDQLASQLDAELMLYEDGRLLHSSARVLAELGLIEPYLPPAVYREVVLRGGPSQQATADRDIGGRGTRVGYRALPTARFNDHSLVLAAPRLADDERLTHNQQDILFGLLLVILIGFGAASGLANTAGRELAKPVQALSDAATAVGMGKKMVPFDPDMPAEFVPVANAFEQMAADVASHQEALEKAVSFTGAVLRNVATGVVALGGELRVTTANPRAVHLLGVDPSPYEPVDHQTGPEWSAFWVWVRVFLNSKREMDAREFTVGDKRIRAQVAVLTAEEGGCVLALDDATELAQAERVLAWGEMARQVAHEIKNPLTPIRLGVQHLQRSRRDKRGDFDATLEKTSRQILAEIERLDAIARAFSRFGAPPAEAEPLALVDVSGVVRETAALYTMGSGTNVSVHADDAVVGKVRKDELKEVLINLVENARGAGASDVSITVERCADSRVCFTVRDNGSGIPADDLPRVFEPKFSTTTSGTGLGLAICKRLVESWGGTVEAESELGKGTAVLFRLESEVGGPS
ncbi:MAG: ATP-binding protein [Gemmatimonadetes bacterium]|nr:ATP-binding protein [Gemmatimonadota bacterium]